MASSGIDSADPARKMAATSANASLKAMSSEFFTDEDVLYQVLVQGMFNDVLPVLSDCKKCPLAVTAMNSFFYRDIGAKVQRINMQLAISKY